jgi:hypothetical protein
MNSKKVCLFETHHFHVIVKDGDRNFAGILDLSSKSVTLKVIGEQDEDRSCTLRQPNLDSLICTYLNAKFLLLGLQRTIDIGTVLERHPKAISYFEHHFDVENVIYFPKRMSSHPTFLSIEFKFGILASWLGNTHKQEEIIDEYSSGERILEKPELFDEFTEQIGDEGCLGVHYSPTIHYSSPSFSAGIHFPPSVYFDFRLKKKVNETILFFKELRTLFEFITGGELDIEEVVLHHNNGSFVQKANLFYPNSKYQNRSRRSSILFPLSRNLRFNSFNLPEFPIELFDSYFRLPEKSRAYFHKYVKYRRIKNVEERFLGYFRILESLCYKTGSYVNADILRKLVERSKPFLFKYFGDRKNVQAFLERLQTFNNSKYNTEKCIGDFLKTIPAELTDIWTYKKSDLANICKLRNDISHANDYRITDAEIEKMCKFCEVLLVIGLFIKLGVSMDSITAVIGRIDDYHLVQGYEKT